MLLAAVVLILAFLALSAMVARVSQLGSETGQDQSRPVLLEVEAVQSAVDDLLVHLQTVTPTLNATSTPTFQTALQAGLRHIAFLESARGFRFEFGGPPVSPDDPLDGLVDCAQGRVWFRLNDDQVRVLLVSEQTFSCNPPTPP